MAAHKISVSLQGYLLKGIDELAEERGLSRSSVISTALVLYLEQLAERDALLAREEAERERSQRKRQPEPWGFRFEVDGYSTQEIEELSHWDYSKYLELWNKYLAQEAAARERARERERVRARKLLGLEGLEGAEIHENQTPRLPEPSQSKMPELSGPQR